MPRTVYYQDVGNPLQGDRLPTTRPQTALAALPLPAGHTAAAIMSAVALLLFVIVMTTLLMPPSPLGWIASPALVYGIVGVFLLFAMLLGLCRMETACPILVVFAAMGVLLFVPIGAMELLLATTIAGSFFVWQFGNHWIAVCTASPLPRDRAWFIRDALKIPLAVCSFCPALIAIGGAIWPELQSFWFWILPALCFLQAMWPVPADSPSKLELICQSLASWFTYNRREFSVPGLLTSPTGGYVTRMTLTCIAAALITASWSQFGSALSRFERYQRRPTWISFGVELLFVSDNANPTASPLMAIGILALRSSFQLFATIGLPFLLTLSILVAAGQSREVQVNEDNWYEFIHDLHNSPDPIESNSYYQGRLVKDGSPLLVPRPIFREHAHFPGDAGSGKTSLGLAPWIEQTILFGDCSVVIIDLKADTLELLATAVRAAEKLYEQTGIRIPIKYFTNQSHLRTFAFNPLTQPFWDGLESYIKTDILCGAVGLLYGTDYGAGWYSEANAAVLHHAIKNYPEARTLRELAERVRDTLVSARKRDLHPELRSAGVHVQAVLDRLGAFEALNVGPNTGHPEEVTRHSIDLTDVFRTPQILYIHLSSTLSPGSSPAIGRLLGYSLLCASSQTKERRQVYLVIDEFQRMVAHNVEYMLQLARSMDVGVILANQSLQDLGDLLPAVEANCRYRQWFSVSSLDDRERLIRGSGETVEYMVSRSTGTNANGATESTTVAEQVMNRLSQNDVALASDHPMQSIVKIARGDGYAQYGGLPFVVETTYHISKKEYDDRKAMLWPGPMEGTFIPKDCRPPSSGSSQPTSPPRPPSGPILTTEFIGDLPLGGPPPLPPPSGRSNRKKRKGGDR